MYKVAVLQNQSEAFELTYGNAFALLMRSFPSYDLDLFTTDDGMRQLISSLDRYDAVIFTSDTLGDSLLRTFWLSDEHCNAFDTFLAKGRGILVLHQDKMVGEMYSFLGEGWELQGIARTREGHDIPEEGELSVGTDHLVLHYPQPVNLDAVAKRSTTNSLVAGLYWHYMLPLKPERWISVVQDKTYTPARDLLLTSGPHVNGRLVVTSLALERQGQLNLLENVVRYVVEGTESLAIIRRDEQISYEFRYLLSYLNVNRVAYREYRSMDLGSVDLAMSVHSVALIDPAWTEQEVTPDLVARLKERLRPEGKLVYIGRYIGQEPTITTVGGRIPFKTAYRDSITWLKAGYDRDLGLWDGSFFSSTHVIEALVAFGEHTDEYRSATLAYIYKHDLNGSYDNVFGATCEMARIYYIFKDIPRFNRSLDRIRRELPGKSSADIARAFRMFRLCGVSANESEIQQVLSDVSMEDSDTNLVRYLRTATAYGFEGLVPRLANALLRRQGTDGSWGVEQVNRIMLTAAAVAALIEARQSLSIQPALKSSVEDAVLQGIIYLQSFDLDHTPNPQKAATVAMALLAIYRFSIEIVFPVEDFVVSQRLVQARTTNIAAFDAATGLISRLQAEKALLESRYEILRREHGGVRYYRKVANALTVTLLLILSAGGLLMIYDVRYLPGGLSDLKATTNGVITHWLLPYWWVVTALIGIEIIVLLTQAGLLPRSILRAIQHLGGLLGLNIGSGRNNDN